MSQQQYGNNPAILQTENGISINLGGASRGGASDPYYAEDGLTPAVGTAGDSAAADTTPYENYGEQMFLVITHNMRMCKDENLEDEDTENMLIEQDSSVLGSYINDYVVYLSEPYYVYVSASDVQILDTTNVDGYQWDTSPANQGASPAAAGVDPANSGLAGILTHVPNKSGQLGLPQGHESQGTTVISDAQAPNLALSNDYSNGYESGPADVTHSRSQSRASNKSKRRRPSSARSHKSHRSHQSQRSTAGSDYMPPEPFDMQPAPQQGQYGQQMDQMQRPESARRSHSRSQSRASQRSHRSHQSHHSRQSSRHSQRSHRSRSGSRADTGATGTGATGASGATGDKDISPETEGMSELSRSRRGSMSSVSTFVDIQPHGKGRGRGHKLPMPSDKDRDAAQVEDGVSEDGSSVHYIAKSQLKSPLYYNQVANEILARRAVNLKDSSRQRDTIVDNIIVNKFFDARPVPGKRYFTQSRRVRNGITVVIPFADEPAQELETTLTQLYYTHEYLVTAKEEWRQRPFHILLVQDGWSQAHPSLQRYLKKMFPKQYYFNESDLADINTSLNAVENVSDEMDGASRRGGRRGGGKKKSRSRAASNASNALSEQNVKRLNRINSQQEDYDIRYGPNDEPSKSVTGVSIHYDDNLGAPNDARSVRSGGKRLSLQREQSVSEYAPSIAMELPSQSQYWWEFHEEFDGSYKPSQGPVTFVFEKTIDNPTYFSLKFNKNEKGRHDKRIENQLTLHLTLIVKLDRRGKHNSREWFLAKSGFAEAYRATYLMTTNAFTLYDIKTLYSLVDYLDRNGDCSVVTGRQRAMTRGMQGKKRTEYKCSMSHILRLTQTFDWELTNNIYNPTYGTVGFLPVVPGQCGLYRASDILQDQAREWYFNEVNMDPKFTGLVLGNLQHVEDRLLTYAAVLKVEGQRRVGYVSDALFYIQITTDIEALVDVQREWIDGTFAGFLYLLWTARWNFWQWNVMSFHKYLIFVVFMFNFLQMMQMFFATAISMSMLQTSVGYIYSNFIDDTGSDSVQEQRVQMVMLFVWIIWLLHLVIHNTQNFHGMIIYLLFMISILTSLLAFFTYLMLIFVDNQGIYDTLFSDFVTVEQYDFIGGLIFWCLFAPFPCSLIVGGFDSTLLLIKSIGAYLFTFHLMWAWLAPYAIVRCWDIDFDSNDHAADKNANDPLNNTEKDEREKMEARFIQKSRLVMVLMIGCNIAAYMVPLISFISIMIFLISLGLFCVVAVLSAMAKSVGVDLRLINMCCVVPDAAPTDTNSGTQPQQIQAGAERDFNAPVRDQSETSQQPQHKRKGSEDSDDGFIVIPEVYQIETKERYERMKNRGLSRKGTAYDGTQDMQGVGQMGQMGQMGPMQNTGYDTYGGYGTGYDTGFGENYGDAPNMQLDSVSQYSQARV